MKLIIRIKSSHRYDLLNDEDKSNLDCSAVESNDYVMLFGPNVKEQDLAKSKAKNRDSGW